VIWLGFFCNLITVVAIWLSGIVPAAPLFWKAQRTGVAYEALRRYLRRPCASAVELLRLARRLRAGGSMADALEVLTG